MITSFELEKIMEKWWTNLNNIQEVAETLDDIDIGGVVFRPWGDKHFYHAKTQKTLSYIKTFQSLSTIENIRDEKVYPILDIYFNITEIKGHYIYKKVRCHVSC